MHCEILRREEALAALGPAWTALWSASAHRPVTLHPAWVTSWWQSFVGDAGDGSELLVVTVRDGADLVGVAPFYLAPPRGGALRARELRLLGDGLIGVEHAVLAAPSCLASVLDSVVEALAAEPGWDVLDLTLEAPRGGGGNGDAEALARRFVALGRDIERGEARGRPIVDLVAPWERFVASRPQALGGVEEPSGARITELTASDLPEGLEVLETLLRRRAREAAAGRPVASAPWLDQGFVAFLSRALPALVEAGVATLRLLESPERGPVAGVVVLVDGDRHIELVRAGSLDSAASEQLTLRSLHRAVDEGARRFEFAELSALADAAAHGERLRVYGRSAASVIQRGYASLVRHASSISDVMSDAASRAPIDTIHRIAEKAQGIAPGVVTRAVARVATLTRLHLYRGELFVRSGSGGPGSPDCRLLSLADFDALAPADRAQLVTRLSLDESRARRDWERGDLVVLAILDGLPVGILWCARGPVFVPDIGREVRPQSGECYIHDVFVAPDARGRRVARAMLEFVARELRGRDFYRAWALIERSNTASTRAFEKARYTSVADVVYARMGSASKLLVQPPDPDARAFVGLRAQ